ncbi:hypothetical protein EPN18_10100 [bacterium]|nr:MAG: hypothetical protein EPN18_10100 [bacterium]
MDMAQLKDIAVFMAPVLSFFLSIAVGMAGFFLKGLINGLKENITNADAKAQRLEREFMEFKAQLPKQYVLKDDYVRALSSFEYKLDSLGKKMDTILKERN